MSNPPLVRRYYWDACAWIGLIKEEKDKITPLRSIWTDATKGNVELWTSTYTLMEVVQVSAAKSDDENDTMVFDLLEQPFVKVAQVDIEVAKLARSLKRKYHQDGLRKKADCIHLATALHYNAEELHTWDAADLLHLNNKLKCRNGALLPILVPGTDYGPLFQQGVSSAQ